MGTENISYMDYDKQAYLPMKNLLKGNTFIKENSPIGFDVDKKLVITSYGYNHNSYLLKVYSLNIGTPSMMACVIPKRYFMDIDELEKFEFNLLIRTVLIEKRNKYEEPISEHERFWKFIYTLFCL